MPGAERLRIDLATVSPQGVTSGGGFTLAFEKTADWDAGNGTRGFTAALTIINESGSPLNDWDLEFDFLHLIDNMWNASFDQETHRYDVTPELWNAILEHGQSRSFGFNGTYDGVFHEPTAYVLSGVPIGSQAPIVPAPIVCALDNSFVTTATWKNGDGSHGFVAEMYVTNVGNAPVNWRLQFELDAEITNMWNASYARDGDAYAVEPALWNVRLESGATRSFGFQATSSNVPTEPTNIVCNQGSAPSVAVLAPGGSVELLDEVTVVDDTPDFPGPRLVVVERVEEADLPLAFPESENRIAPFYRFSSDELWWAGRVGLEARVRLPEGVDPYGLALQAFIPAESLDHPPPSGVAGLWAAVPITYDAETHEAVFRLNVLRPEGLYVTFSSGNFTNK